MSQLKRLLFEEGKLPRWMNTKTLPATLSQRQWDSVTRQAHAMMDSWIALAESMFRTTVRASALDGDMRHKLFTINKRHAWYEHDRKDDSAHRMARRIMKHVRKRMHMPNVRHCHTMSMDGKIAKIEPARNTGLVRYWVRVSTLAKGHPILIPLVTSGRLMQALDHGEQLAQHLQVTISQHGAPVAHLMTTQPIAKPREDGEVLGLDWGLRTMFAVSDGRLEGLRMYAWLKQRDEELVALTKSLQKNGVKPSKSKRYKRLNKRIRDYVTNEVNRILNKIADEHVREIVVEDLDFRGKGLNKTTNRIMTRAGRKAVRSKLDQLQAKHGVTVTTVNPAYTSQQCSACGHVDKTARKGEQYTCVCCKKRMHADVNASRNILARRSRQDGWKYINKERVHSMLIQEHGTRYAPHSLRGERGHAEPEYGSLARGNYSRVRGLRIIVLQSTTDFHTLSPSLTILSQRRRF